MALVTNFNERIKDLAGSLTPADLDSIEQWMVDGCIDVVDRVKKMLPYKTELFTKNTNLSGGSTSLDLQDIGDILYVENNGKEVRIVDKRFKEKLSNSSSIHYSTSNDPAAYISNGYLNFVPSINTSGALSSIPTTYTISNFNANSSSIANFPDQYVGAVILYAAIKVLKRRVLDKVMPTLDISGLSAPANISGIGNNTVAGFGSAPSYDFTGFSNFETALATLIDTSEDIELATAKISEINIIMQNHLNEFNEANVAYQASVNAKIEDLRAASQEDAHILQKHSSEVQRYSAEVGALIQEYTSDIQAYGTHISTLSSQAQALEVDYNRYFEVDA
tara:strand:+ start:2996 stop:4000 length:1005 start_codon:yes stop_codon:yes gene_type:complete